MSGPKPRQWACALVWAGLLILPLALIAGIASSWLMHVARLDESIAAREDQLLRFQRLIQTLPTLRQELAAVSDNQALKAFYFDAPTPALAGAQVQGKVQDIVSGANARLISTQLLPEQPGDTPPRVRVRTQIQGTTEALLEILYHLEEARPFLFVDQLSVRSSARPQQLDPRRRTVRRRPNTAGDLTIRLDIFGYALVKDS